jgi:hypothetical protein
MKKKNTPLPHKKINPFHPVGAFDKKYRGSQQINQKKTGEERNKSLIYGSKLHFGIGT